MFRLQPFSSFESYTWNQKGFDVVFNTLACGLLKLFLIYYKMIQ